MNFNLGFNAGSLGQGQVQVDAMQDLSMVRKNMAFDYCFKSLYPKNASEQAMRACILEYRQYCKLTQKIFTQVVKQRRMLQQKDSRSQK